MKTLRRIRMRVRTIANQLSRELARLNSARLSREELAQLPRKQRTAVVKRALARHHRDTARCC